MVVGAALLGGVGAKLVVRHPAQAEPDGEDRSQHPGEHDPPEDPVGEAEDDARLWRAGFDEAEITALRAGAPALSTR